MLMEVVKRVNKNEIKKISKERRKFIKNGKIEDSRLPEKRNIRGI
jgi:hypothetical protein